MANRLIDSITWDSQLAGTEISYYLAPKGQVFATDEGNKTSTSMNGFVREQVAQLLDTVSNLVNLTFTKGNSSSDFRVLLTSDLSGTTDGFMGPPGEDFAGLGVFKAVGTAKFETGAYNYMVMVHEFMHALGLAHPHDDGGNSRVLRGVTADDDLGAFNLNQGVYTVMTYNNGWASGVKAPNNGLYGYETGPMALDIAVLQEKYGANMGFATGSDNYALVGTNAVGTGWMSIWDAGGVDKIFYSGARDAVIDLRPATLLYEAGGGGWISSVAGIAGGFTIAYGVVIEKARGGLGDDILRGNSAANTLLGSYGNDTLHGGNGQDYLVGGAGNDVLYGGKGSDVYTGGTGSDRFVFSQTPQADRITEFSSGHDKIGLSALGDIDVNIVVRDGQWVVTIDTDGDQHIDGRIFVEDRVLISDLILA